ncbi:MAG: B12-binding domain-containing radical SAM protein [Promethearchaeota archaeon]
MKVLFIEPPKQPWFVMGNYLPPPLALLCLAAYLEKHVADVEIRVMDCQAEEMVWAGVEDRIKQWQPDVVAPSTLSTCNANLALRVATLAKEVSDDIQTVLGGQHFSVFAKDVLKAHPQVDFIVIGEGEVTFTELVKALDENTPLAHIQGLAFRQHGNVVCTEKRPQIQELDTLPFPGYHFVTEHMTKYRFPAAKKLPYALVEGSRGCDHVCAFCSQWRYWGRCRRKSPKRVADEFEYLYREFGSRFLWLTDDYVKLDGWMETLCDELLIRGITEDLMWFFQSRADEIVSGRALLPKLRETGLQWIMTGLETHNPQLLNQYGKGFDITTGKEAIKLLKEHDILAQTTAIIGDRHESQETLDAFREWINEIDPDIAVFMTMTPYPGTPLYTEAVKNGWIEDSQWTNFDMIHAIMPTEQLTRQEVQKELYCTYRSFYNWSRRIRGTLVGNKVKKRYYRHMMWKGFLGLVKGLFRF